MTGYPDQAAAVAATLADLDARPNDRVLIMLPDGPDFAAAFAGVIQHGAVPLPVNPLLPAHDIMTLADQASAHLILASADQIDALANLSTQPPVPMNGPQGPWAALLRLR
ncbi:MAG: AMP-binding protein [Actinomycetota bacterium]|nr:AMP-binding protein [Actinomycetota bacterium]